MVLIGVNNNLDSKMYKLGGYYYYYCSMRCCLMLVNKSSGTGLKFIVCMEQKKGNEAAY